MLAVLIGLPTCSLLAQSQNDAPPQDGPPPGQQGEPGGPREGGHHRPPMLILLALDTNKDGVLSADEIANAPVALKTLDKNNDGQLTEDEYHPHPSKGQGQDGPPPGDASGPDGSKKHKRPAPAIMKALDTNGDGIISADEIANASASLLKLDKNGDGKLSMDEIMGPRPPRPEGDGGDGGPGGPDGGNPPPPNN